MSAGNIPVPHQQYSAAGSRANPNSTSADSNASKEAPVEDCRDYLRTGRCKYGASCKYRHPPNVQSGGGMKTPLNPTEPMFPIRPNEPICQYFLKHGTCKFGQACKFHHPPSSAQQQHYVPATALPVGASPVLLTVAPGRKMMEPTPQLVAVGPPRTDVTQMMVQFLPQRPEEPDCIYFLKNGRCKYGATCRYHHPVHAYANPSPQPRHPRHPRNSQSDMYSSSGPKRIPYAAHQAGSGHPPSHIVVASEGGGPVSFVGLDHSIQAQTSYKPVSYVSPGGDSMASQQQQVSHGVLGVAPVFSGSTVMTEQGSSASSIASSFDTASSGMELSGNDVATAALWTRARKNGSVGSLNAFDKSRPSMPINNITNSNSDGNIAMRAHSVSLGSAGDYYGESTPPSGARAAQWRGRSSSFDMQTARNTNYSNQGPSENPGNAALGAHQAASGRPPMAANSGIRQRQSRGGPNGDEGFTMMTSALLNMLDTQEETSAEAYSEDEGSFIAGSRSQSTSGWYQGNFQNEVCRTVPSNLMENLTLEPNTVTSDVQAVHQQFPSNQQPHPPSRWPPTQRDEQSRQQHSIHGSYPSPANGGGPQTSLGLYLP